VPVEPVVQAPVQPQAPVEPVAQAPVQPQAPAEPVPQAPVQSAMPVPQQLQPPAEQPPDLGFEMLNVQEYLLRKEVIPFLAKFDTCSCPRCVADVTALAMNNLDQRYAVIETQNMAPLLSFYKNKLRPNIIFELSKAIMVVKDNPHH
ncbi:MAG: late competence development ComFB family protein, partial [Bacillota bacterium]